MVRSRIDTIAIKGEMSPILETLLSHTQEMNNIH